MGTEISVVIPALNEDGSVAEAISRACASVARIAGKYEVIVVDDGSSDRTQDIVREAAARNPAVRLIRHQRNLGYGKALRDGFGAARYDTLFFTDADGQFDMDHIGRLVEHAPGKAIVTGYRQGKQYGRLRKFASAGYNLLVNVFFRAGARDVNCAFKLIRRDILQEMRLESSGFFINAELLVKARRAGLEITEVPVPHFPRPAGTSKVRFSHVFITLAEMLRFASRG